MKQNYYLINPDVVGSVQFSFLALRVQGVYGLVTNLGSLAVRNLFQPFEEAAFLAFSRPAASKEAAVRKLHVLAVLVRLVVTVGGAT